MVFPLLLGKDEALNGGFEPRDIRPRLFETSVALLPSARPACFYLWRVACATIVRATDLYFVDYIT